MTWQGDPASGSGSATPDDETRVDWVAPVGDAPPPPPAPPPSAPTPAPPPPTAGGPTPVPATPWAPAPDNGGLKFGGVLPRLLAWWLDGFLLGIVLAVVAGVLGAVMGSVEGATLVSIVVYVGLTYIYFVGMWTGSGQATLGMRLFNLRVGNATDGRELTMSQATVRWFAMGMWISAVAVLPPPVSTLVSMGGTLWYLVLLISTVASPVRQGIHDRIAGSAMTAPIGREGPIVPCAVLFVVLFVVLMVVAVVGLIALGAALSQMITVDPGPSY